MKLAVTACAAIAIAVASVPAQALSTEKVGTGVAVALPIVAGGLTLWKKDWTGTAQLVVSTALTVGTAYGLKQVIKECRPFAEPCTKNGGGWNSMPSDTAAAAFAPAQFLWQRYGWEYGVPAYAAATFVGWSRVDAKKHHWYDVATSFGISLIYNELITTRFHERRGFYTNLNAEPGGAFASVGYRW